MGGTRGANSPGEVDLIMAIGWFMAAGHKTEPHKQKWHQTTPSLHKERLHP